MITEIKVLWFIDFQTLLSGVPKYFDFGLGVSNKPTNQVASKGKVDTSNHEINI